MQHRESKASEAFRRRYGGLVIAAAVVVLSMQGGVAPAAPGNPVPAQAAGKAARGPRPYAAGRQRAYRDAALAPKNAAQLGGAPARAAKETILATKTKTYAAPAMPFSTRPAAGDGGGQGLATVCTTCPAANVNCPEGATGVFQAGDCVLADGRFVDLYAFAVAEPTRLEAFQRSSELDCFLYLLDANCVLVAANDDCEGLNSCIRIDLFPGSYFFAASTFSIGATGAYRLDLSCTPAVNPCTDCVVGSVACGAPVAATLGTSGCTLGGGQSIDTRRLEVPELGVLTIDMRSSAIDPVLFLYDASCRLVAGNDDFPGLGFNARIENVLLEAGTYFVGSSSFGVGVNLDVDALAVLDGIVYILNYSSDTITVYDPATDQVLRTLTPGAGDLIGGMAGIRGPDAILVSTGTGAVLEVDPQTGAVVSSFQTAAGFAVGIAVAGGEVFVSDFNAPTVYVYDPAGTLQRTFDLAAPASGLGGDGAATRLFATIEDGSGSIVELNPADGTEIARINAPEPLSAGPNGIAYEGQFLYYISGFGSDRLWTLNPDTGAVIEEVSLATPSYDLEVTCVDVRACTGCTLGAIQCGVPVSSALGASGCLLEDGRRVDRWSLDVTQLTDLVISATSANADLSVALTSVLCQPIVEADAGCEANPGGACLVRHAVQPGSYWVTVSGANAGVTGNYDLSVDCPPFNPCTSCVAGTVACGQTVQGTLEPSDCPFGDGTFHDTWVLDLAERQRLRIDMQSPEFDTFMLLTDASCVVIAGNDDCEGTFNSCITTELPPGRYFVVTNSFALAFGAYSLQVACTPALDPCTQCVAGSLACGESRGGVLGERMNCTLITGQPIETYSFELTEQQSVTVTMTSGVFDTFVYLYDGSCAVLAQNDDAPGLGLNSRIANFTLAAGTYHIGASSFLAGGVNYDIDGLAVLGGLVYILNYGGDQIIAFDPVQGTVVRTLTPGIGDLIGGLAAIHSPDRLLVTSGTDLVALSPTTGAEIVRIPTGASFPVGVAVAGGEILVSDFNTPQIFVYSRDGAFLRTLTLPWVTDALGGDDEGGRVFAVPSDGSGSIVEIDSLAGLEVSRFPAPEAPSAGPNGLAFDGETLYYLSGFGSDQIWRLDPDTGAVLGAASLPSDPTYQIDLRCSDPIVFCEDCVVGPAVCGGTSNGVLTAESCARPSGHFIDLYDFQLPVAADVSINLDSAVLDPYLFLYDSNCNVLAENDDFNGLNSFLQLASLPAGSYRIGASTFAAGAVGQYALRVTCPGGDLCGTCQVGTIACGETVQGTLAGDSCSEPGAGFLESWRLTIAATTMVEIALASAEFDALLTVRNAGCQELGRNDDCGASLNSCLALTLEPGTYWIGAAALFPADGGAYSLSVRCPRPGGRQRPADCDQSGRIDITDGICILGYLFRGVPASLPCGDAGNSPGNVGLLDLDQSGRVELTDAVRIFLYLFLGGPPHPLCADETCMNCVELEGCPDVCAP